MTTPHIYSVKSNCTRAAKRAHPDGSYELHKTKGGWYFEPKTTTTTKKDADLHDTFKAAYAFFNEHLFDNRLPSCMILIHRKRNVRGYFWAEQWHNKKSGEGRHEIAMNPDNFHNRTDEDILSTLVHEMTHLEQQVFGKPGLRGYHNTEWVDLMLAVGLLPYAVTEPVPVWTERGGFEPMPRKQVGTKVTHVVIPGGFFSVACAAFLAQGHEIAWTTHTPSEADKAIAKLKRASKTKFTCPKCGLNAWAKPDAVLGCWTCGVEMYEA